MRGVTHDLYEHQAVVEAVLVLDVGFYLGRGRTGDRNVHHIDGVAVLAFPIDPGLQHSVKHGVFDHQDASLFAQNGIFGLSEIEEHVLVNAGKGFGVGVVRHGQGVGEVGSHVVQRDAEPGVNPQGLRGGVIHKGLEAHRDAAIVPDDEGLGEIGGFARPGFIAVVKIREGIGNRGRIDIPGQVSFGRRHRQVQFDVFAVLQAQSHLCGVRNDHAAGQDGQLGIAGLQGESFFLEEKVVPGAAVDLHRLAFRVAEGEFQDHVVGRIVQQADFVLVFAEFQLFGVQRDGQSHDQGEKQIQSLHLSLHTSFKFIVPDDAGRFFIFLQV